MKMKTMLAVFTLFLLAGLSGPWGQEVGPAQGALVVVGGAMKDPAILERFIQLAGGKDAPIVVIPTAGGREEYGMYWGGLRAFREAGISRLTVLHTTDPHVADTPEFVKPLQEARGVFFSGGRQWRLADAYLNTRTHKELHAVLARGGVIKINAAMHSMKIANHIQETSLS